MLSAESGHRFLALLGFPQEGDDLLVGKLSGVHLAPTFLG
jgi:hypothetical protein